MGKSLLLAFILSVIFQSCKTSLQITDHDYTYDANFNKFQTFEFVRCDSDTNEYCTEIQATIQKQMEIRGYKYSPNNADIYIGYSLLSTKIKYKAFKQPILTNWVNKYDSDESYKVEKYNFHKGMIMLSIIEAKTNVLIWRGFASDISKRKKENINMNHYYSVAIRNIFREYPLFASRELL
jgi:Domain of unknown function (DUF4136)